MSGLPELSRASSDADLVTAYLAGDEQAATTLVLRHADGVARFLYASGALAEDLEDLVQETFFRAFRKITGWRGEATFRSWLLTIAGNLRKDVYRRIRGRTLIPMDGHDPPDSRDPENELVAIQVEERMRQSVMALPRLQREVFLLRVQEGIGYDEIATALGTTPGAARVHYHQAIKRLKEAVS